MMARVHSAAAEVGLSPEAWVADRVVEMLKPTGMREDAGTFEAERRGDSLLAQQTPEARAFQHAAARAALEEYDRTGECISLDDWAAEFRKDVEARLTAR